MQKHDLDQLHTLVQDLSHRLADTADEKDFSELLQIIHKPGFTSVAEAMFVSAIVNSMHSHTKSLSDLKKVLLEGSRAIVDGQKP
jgi:hypothetical protein